MGWLAERLDAHPPFGRIAYFSREVLQAATANAVASQLLIPAVLIMLRLIGNAQAKAATTSGDLGPWWMGTAAALILVVSFPLVSSLTTSFRLVANPRLSQGFSQPAQRGRPSETHPLGTGTFLRLEIGFKEDDLAVRVQVQEIAPEWHPRTRRAKGNGRTEVVVNVLKRR